MKREPLYMKNVLITYVVWCSRPVIRNLQFQYPNWLVRRGGLGSIGLRLRHVPIPIGTLAHKSRLAQLVLSAGVEPAFFPSEGNILSIERRELLDTPS